MQTKIIALRNATREREREGGRERDCTTKPSSRIYTCYAGKGISLRMGYLTQDSKVGPNVPQLMNE